MAKHDVSGQVGDRSFHAHSDGQVSGTGGFATERSANQPRFAEPQEEQEQVAKRDARGTVIKSEDREDASSRQEDQSIPAHSHMQSSGAESQAGQPSRGERQKERKTKDRYQDDERGPTEEDTGGGGLALAKNLRAKRVARYKELALLQAEKETEARRQTNDQNPTENDTGGTDTDTNTDSDTSHVPARGDGSCAKQLSVAELQEEQEQVGEYDARGTVIKSEDLEGGSSGQED